MKYMVIDRFTKRSLRPLKCAVLNRGLKTNEKGLYVALNTEGWRKNGRLELSFGAVRGMAKKMGMVDGEALLLAEIELADAESRLMLANQEIALLIEKLRVLFGEEPDAEVEEEETEEEGDSE